MNHRDDKTKNERYHVENTTIKDGELGRDAFDKVAINLGRSLKARFCGCRFRTGAFVRVVQMLLRVHARVKRFQRCRVQFRVQSGMPTRLA